eukprot:358532-Chlamydomonas_euryale.AAC.1
MPDAEAAAAPEAEASLLRAWPSQERLYAGSGHLLSRAGGAGAPLEDFDLLRHRVLVRVDFMCVVSRSSKERGPVPEYEALLSVMAVALGAAELMPRPLSGPLPSIDLKAFRMRLPCVGGLLTVVGLTSAWTKTSLGLNASDSEIRMRCVTWASAVHTGVPSVLAGPASSDTNDASERRRLGLLLGRKGSNATTDGVSFASVLVVKRTLIFLSGLELGFDSGGGLSDAVSEICEASW